MPLEERIKDRARCLSCLPIFTTLCNTSLTEKLELIHWLLLAVILPHVRGSMMFGYDRKIWESERIKSAYSAKVHLVSVPSHWGRQILGRQHYLVESMHSSAAIQQIKCSCSNQIPEEERKISAQRKTGKRFRWGKRNAWVLGIFKDSNNRATTSVRDRRTKWNMQLQRGKGRRNLIFSISSEARIIYVYLLRFFHKLPAVLQS